MASSIVVTIKSERVQADLARLLTSDQSGGRRGGILRLARFVHSFATGLQRGVVTIQTASAAPVSASVTATLVSVPVDDTIILAGVTLTAKASPANENQFSQAGTDTQDAASLAAVINAHSVLSLILSATSALGVVTVSAKQAGLIGNQVAVSRTGTAITLSSAKLAGGTGGATSVPKIYTAGIA